MTDYSARGRAAQAAGESFEGWLDGQHSFALINGILAHIEHNQAKTKMIKGRLRYVAKGTCDYTGVLDRVGRTVAVEAKSTKAKSFSLKGVKKKQQDHLTATALAGGLALLVVEFRSITQPYRARYAIPWLDVPWIIKKSAKTISPSQLEKWKVAIGECYLEKYHARGVPTSRLNTRTYARE